jgi:hypothetical protein
MIDFESVVATINSRLGEPMTFIPSTGEPAFAITGVMHEASRMMSAAEGVEYVSEVPTISTSISLIQTVIGRRPLQEDRLIVPRLGNEYIVREARYDGLGAAWLLLNFVGGINAE